MREGRAHGAGPAGALGGGRHLTQVGSSAFAVLQAGSVVAAQPRRPGPHQALAHPVRRPRAPDRRRHPSLAGHGLKAGTDPPKWGSGHESLRARHSRRRSRRMIPCKPRRRWSDTVARRGNGDAATRCVSMRRPALRRDSPTVLTGVKGLRCAPVLADGLRPHLTPAPLRRGLQ